MFHHFHNNIHPKGQGSINDETFENILDYYSKKNNILSADIFYDKFQKKTLEEFDVCLTFDDNLKCQYDIALPILEKYSLKAFWFVYSSPFEGIYEKIEIYRYFRSKFFNSFDEFYELFFEFLKNHEEFKNVFQLLENFDSARYLSEFSFYSKKDKIFRYTRDNILGEKKYVEVMDSIIEKSELNLNISLHKSLWMGKDDLIDLSKKGNLIGLHSHTHPTRIGEKSKKNQYENYKKNKEILEDLLGEDLTSMSHPCNSYNSDTLEVLNSLDIKIGFRSNMETGFESNLEIPRIDHSEITKLL